jgi:hypothetical protein
MTYTPVKNNARRVIVLYGIMEDCINVGSIVGLNMWSESLLDCMTRIETDNIGLFNSGDLNNG